MDRQENLCRILRRYRVPDPVVGRDYILRAAEIMDAGGPVGPALRALLIDEFGVEQKQFTHALYLIRRRMTRRGWTPDPLPRPEGPMNALFFLRALYKQAGQES